MLHRKWPGRLLRRPQGVSFHVVCSTLYCTTNTMRPKVTPGFQICSVVLNEQFKLVEPLAGLLPRRHPNLEDPSNSVRGVRLLLSWMQTLLKPGVAHVTSIALFSVQSRNVDTWLSPWNENHAKPNPYAQQRARMWGNLIHVTTWGILASWSAARAEPPLRGAKCKQIIPYFPLSALVGLRHVQA